MHNFILYRILNLKTRKFYIGRTTTTLKKRWFVHISHAKYGDTYSEKQNKKVGQSYLYRAIRKYGLENFEIKQIDEAKSYDHMVFLENFYIQYYNSLDPKYGYNLVTDKYDSGNQRISSEEYIRKISIKTHEMYGIPSGIRYDKSRNKYLLSMKYMCKTLICKRFDSEEEAKITHDKIELLFYKENPLLYFPDKKEEFLKENLEDFYKKINIKKKSYSKYFGLSRCGNGFNIRIAIGEKIRICIGFEKDEKQAAIKFDKIAYYLGYNREELNIPELWNDQYLEEGKEIFEKYSTPCTQVRRKKEKTSKYNGVNKTNNNWSMELIINSNRIREYYKLEVDAAIAHDFYRRKFNSKLIRLNFPNEIVLEKPIDIKQQKLLDNKKH